MRILVTGASGQLGRDVVDHWRACGDEVFGLGRADLDVSDRDAVVERARGLRPDVVVNCAAWTAVDDCESDPDRAERVNGAAVGHLAVACAEVGARLIQISTDYVFDGAAEGAYEESATPNPQSVYGQSKLLGEMLAGPEAAVVRTSWVCSAHGGNMVATILRLAKHHPTLRFVADQRGRPTFTSDLAVALRELARRDAAGVFHFANQGAVSWFEFAQAVLEAAGEDPTRVEPIATVDLDPPRPAPRPANSVLATGRYESLGLSLRPFHDPLREVVTAYP